MKFFSRDPYDDRPDGLRRRLADLPPGVRWGALAALSIFVLLVGWLAIDGFAAKSSLEQARTAAEQSKDALLSGKSEDATRFAENAQFHARQAQGATHSLPWNIAAAVPFLGSPLKTTQQISDVVVGLADDVLLPGATMGAGLSPEKLIDGTRLDLKLLRAEQPRLTELATAAAKLDAEAQAISSPSYVPLISDARSQLQDQTSRLAQLLGNTSIAAQLAPSMLGADGPRAYLMVFQSPAEARGTGGIVGGVGLLRFNNGVPSVEQVRSNYELFDATANIDLGPEFNKAYGWTNPLNDFRNSNLSPHFPYAAQIWKSMWERKKAGGGPGEVVDGVISLDPVALSYVLGAIGPVTLPGGELISQDNIVELTMSTAYARFETDSDQSENMQDANILARKNYLLEIGSAIAKKLAGPVTAPRKLLDALGRAASERRIAVWSASPAEQRLLEETPLAHIVPEDDAPYVQVVVNNLAGNKMDYYLEREIEYAADGCNGNMRNSTITVRLTNKATDKPLPEYVAGSPGIAGGPLKVPNGTMVTSVQVIATKGAKLMSVTSNGKRTAAITNTERGRPTFELQVAIPPGQSGELSFRLSEPASPGEPRVPIQPLIDTVAPKVSVPACPR